MFGFVISLMIFSAGFICNIVIYNSVSSVGDAILYCALIVAAAAVGLIFCIAAFKKTFDREGRKFPHIGIYVSTATMIVTLIFLICDIVSINTLHYVPVYG